jgi:hypothetical protein
MLKKEIGTMTSKEENKKHRIVTRPQGWGGVGRRLWWWGLAVGGNGEGEVAARVWERGAKSLRAEG